MANGIVISSNYLNGKKHGQFKTLFPDGSKFTGSYNIGEESSVGVYTDIKGTIYKGSFSKGKLNSLGTALYTNGDRYEGNFKLNIKHGEGTLTQQDGSYYHGGWFEDYQHGNGHLYYCTTGQKRKGTWDKGTLINFTSKLKRQSTCLVSKEIRVYQSKYSHCLLI